MARRTVRARGRGRGGALVVGRTDPPDPQDVSRKRGAAREVVDEREEGAAAAADEEATLVPRKPTLLSNGQLDREDRRFKRADEDEAEKMRKQFESTLVLLDEETGESREFDTKSEADLAFLAREKDMDVLSRTDGVHGMPEDMRTGMINITKAELPEDINTTNVLPLSGFQMKSFMRDMANTFADILMFTPIIPIPVYTPKLLNLLMLGTPSPPTQDSFQLLKTYMAVVHLLLAGDSTRKRSRSAIDWLCTRVEDRSLTRTDVERFAAHVQFRCAVDDPDADDVLRRSLLLKFDAGDLADVDSIRAFAPFIATVHRYDGAGWMGGGRVFGEDVMEEHTERGITLCEEVGDVVDRALAADPIAYTEVFGVVQIYTLRFLHLYETTIMRLLEEASIIGATIPRKYFDGLSSPTDRVPEPAEAHLIVCASVRAAREFLTVVRNETLDLGVQVVHNTPKPDVVLKRQTTEDNAHNDCVPTVQELHAYLAFVNYHADDASVFAESVARMQQAVHSVVANELIEGISVPAEEPGQ